ncbi:MAG: helix-turn-helix transcriptional regulator [Clostridia bacterium]|nr:helix-turn-helix transcriptional regulator [Clostridia bacterium]
MIRLEFSDKIRALRKEMDMTQWQLADALETAQRKVPYWESGKIEPDLKTLWKLADFFDVSIDFLIGRRNF